MWLASITGRVAARFDRGGPFAAEDEPAQAAPAHGRALVAVAPASRIAAHAPVVSRPLAPFLTQLIATKQDAPQTRARRRAGLGAAVAEYAGREAAGQFDPRPHAIRSV